MAGDIKDKTGVALKANKTPAMASRTPTSNQQAGGKKMKSRATFNG